MDLLTAAPYVLILVLVGFKLIVEEATGWHPPAWQPLSAIAIVLGVSIVASLPHREEPDELVEEAEAADPLPLSDDSGQA